MISLYFFFFFFFFAIFPLPPTSCLHRMILLNVSNNTDKTSVSSDSVVPIFSTTKKLENKCGLSWLQKGTKTRLKCITSLDSVQQLRRVLLCVRLCSWTALAQAPVIFTELRLMSGWRRRQCHLMNNVWFDKTQMDNYHTHHKKFQASCC